MTDLGVAAGAVIDAVEVRDLTPEDTVATSIYELVIFNGVPELDALGFSFVSLGGLTNEFAPAQRSA